MRPTNQSTVPPIARTRVCDKDIEVTNPNQLISQQNNLNQQISL